MKIAYVYDAVYPWETGGVQKRVWELARRLADRHDVHWYGLHYWDGPPVSEREGVTMHGVEKPRNLYVDGRRSIPEALSFAVSLFRPLRNQEFDVIDCQEFPYFPCFTAKCATLSSDTPLLVTWHEVWGSYWSEYLGRMGVLGKAVERLAAGMPAHHVAVSEHTRRDLRALGVQNVEVVPNGLEMSAVKRAPPAERDIDVLFTGRLIEEKNAALLVQAISELRTALPDIQCVLLGEGPERDRIERLISALELQESVTLLGFRESHEEILGLMKAADVFALPSRREGFGITALEAMGCGTPVVTIAHPQNAAQDLVDDEVTGAICEPRPDALARAILKARQLSSKHCLETASQYDWEVIVSEAETVYRAIEPAPQGERGSPEVV